MVVILMRGKHQFIKECRLIMKFHSESLRRIRMINRSFNRQIEISGKNLTRLNSQTSRIHSASNFILIQLPLPASKIAKKVIMSKYNLARKLFGLEESDSDDSGRSVIFISRSEDESSDWETDYSTDTEQLVARIEKEVTSSSMLIGGRVMTMDEPSEDELKAGPSSTQMQTDVTPKFGHKYFDKEMCYAPPQKTGKSRIELCKTLLPVPESPMSPPDHERGPSLDTPLMQSVMEGFHASYHVQNTKSYENLSTKLYSECKVCGRSSEAIKKEKVDWYVARSKPRGEPEYLTKIRRVAYENGLNAGAFLFITPAVSQAAACDGTLITTTATRHEIIPGTLPTF